MAFLGQNETKILKLRYDHCNVARRNSDPDPARKLSTNLYDT